MADDTVVFLCISRKESRYVFKRDQRNIEAVAEADETAGLVAGINIEHTGQVSRLVGYDTYRTASHAGETDDDVLGKVGHYFKEIAVVYHSFNDILHVVGNIRISGNNCIQRCIFTVEVVCAVLLLGFVHIVLRQERQQFADAHQQFFFVIAHKVSNPTLAAVSHGTAQFFLAHFFMDHCFHYIRSGDKHVTLFFHHENKVGEGRRVAGTSGTRAEDSRNLRNDTAGHCILIEDICVTRKAFDTFLNTCTTRIIQCNDRSTVFQSQLLHFNDFLGVGSRQ